MNRAPTLVRPAANEASTWCCPYPNEKGRRTAPRSNYPAQAQALTAAHRQAYLAAGISFSVYQPSLCQSASPDLALMSPSTR